MLEDKEQGRIDALFRDFIKPDTPGLALGVIVHGEMVYSRGYGIANLEYDIPVSTKTVFHIASMSKQFTAMSIALLEEQGLVRLEDDIRVFFPELPQYPWPITVGNLVYMTNGLYDLYTLANYIVGVRENDFFTREQAWQLIKACDWLMFQPGTKWSYGNTGYFLLAQLVERVTRQSLSEFADKNIFSPLGMNNTFFRDDRTRIIKNRAESYSDYAHIHYNTVDKPWSTRGHKTLVNSDPVELPGAGQVWSTVEDLYRWDNNFYANQLGKGSMDLIRKITTPGKLTDGTPVPYGYGLFIGNKDGFNYVSHGGWSHGWSCYMHRIPEKRCTVVCLANHTNSIWPLEVWAQSYSLPEQVMEIVLEGFEVKRKHNPAVHDEKTERVPAPDDFWSRFVGKYQNPIDSWILTVESREGRGFARVNYGEELELTRFGDTSVGSMDNTLTIQLAEGGQGVSLAVDGKEGQIFTPFVDTLESSALQEYAGEYRCESLDTSFLVKAESSRLLMLNKNRRNTAVDFRWTPTIADSFLAEYPPYCPFYCITFTRNAAGEISAMVFRDDEGSKRENLVFAKIR